METTPKALEVKNIEKSYGKVHVLKDLSLFVKDKEFLVLLGPSGCGKTTLLRIIAGLTPMDSGSVVLTGKDITNTPAYQRDIGMVFQNYALFPHKSVFDNVAFGLRMRHIAKEEIKIRVEEALRTVHLEGLGDRAIAQLSGGQQQRVALARALVINPSLLLLDEPLSNLDAKLRMSVRVEIAQIQKRLGITSILVTHDQVEALTMGDHIVLMREGIIQQSASPVDIYEKPCNVFVASFIGSPAINLFSINVDGNNAVLSECSHCISLDSLVKSLRKEKTPGQFPNGEYILGIRPEDIELSDATGDDSLLTAEVVFVELLGSDTYIHLDCQNKTVVARSPTNVTSIQSGDRLALNIKPERAHLFNAATEKAVDFLS